MKKSTARWILKKNDYCLTHGVPLRGEKKCYVCRREKLDKHREKIQKALSVLGFREG